jgi:uncharacterized protein (DUF2141 family)
MARVKIIRRNRAIIKGKTAIAIIGDVNNDGTVDEKDLSIVHKEYAKAKAKKATPKKVVSKKPVAKAKAPVKKKSPAKKKK